MQSNSVNSNNFYVNNKKKSNIARVPDPYNKVYLLQHSFEAPNTFYILNL